jgi:integrase
MAINFFVNRDSIYALYRKQKNGQRINLTYYPGIQINEEWNPDRQRFYPKTPELENLNKRLIEVEVAFNKVIDLYDPFKLENDKLAQLIEDNIKNKPRHTPFFEYCDTYFEHASKQFTRRRSQQVLTAINKLKDFNPNLTFEQIDKRFYRDFTQFLRDKDFSVNYIGSIIKNLKRILNYATENEENKNLEYQNFKKPNEEVFNIYLTEQEIDAIYNLVIDEKLIRQYHQKKNEEQFLSARSIKSQIQALDRARKLFVIGCWTGLRVENYLNIDPEIQVDPSGKFLHAIANKNGPKLRIPIHKLVRQIISVDGFPQSISQQKLNQQIKVLGEMAEINDSIIFTRTKGNKRIEYTKYKYELITTHTARRSFASNLLSRGIPKQFIMAVTGHKTESNFNKYTAAVQKDIMTEKLADYNVWQGLDEKKSKDKKEKVEKDKKKKNKTKNKE